MVKDQLRHVFIYVSCVFILHLLLAPASNAWTYLVSETNSEDVGYTNFTFSYLNFKYAEIRSECNRYDRPCTKLDFKYGGCCCYDTCGKTKGVALPTYFEVINYLNFAPYFFIAFLLVLTCIVSVPIYCCKKLTWCSSILRVLVFCATILFEFMYMALYIVFGAKVVPDMGFKSSNLTSLFYMYAGISGLAVMFYCSIGVIWSINKLKDVDCCSVTRKYKWKLDHLRWTNYKPVFTEQKQQNGDQHLKLRSV
ncbi:uncharacterized protein LOC128202973 [Mya arenaria]|uniref:uncharacterized protein LOC128202973 n=1 Tax=Mya arenaria TaxID=6604 RepID=UPI0022E0D74E|nr:uncharacterized protein LOC128202973 [Mya arenaria]